MRLHRSIAGMAPLARLLMTTCIIGCAQVPTLKISPPPAEQEAKTDWHRERVFEKIASRNIVLYIHSDESFRTDTILELLQAQYDFLREYTGGAPDWILVHVGVCETHPGEIPGL